MTDVKTDTEPPLWPGFIGEGDELAVYIDHVGRANDLLLREKTLVKHVMLMLASRLERRELEGKHLDMIARFLANLGTSEDHHHTSLAVLGRTDAIRRGRSKDDEVRWWETREVYESLMEDGVTEGEALRAAWETWVWDPYSDQQKSFEVESQRPAGDGKTMYQQQVEMLKSRLNKAGSRKPAPRGRKPRKLDP